MTDLDEIRTIDDCWLVQEFRKRYSEEETQEAIAQISKTLTHTLQTYKDETLEALKQKWPEGKDPWIYSDGETFSEAEGFNEALKQAWLVVEESLK